MTLPVIAPKQAIQINRGSGLLWLILRACLRPCENIKACHTTQVIEGVKRIALQVLSQKHFNRWPVRKQARVCIRPAKQDEILAEGTAQVEPVGMGHNAIIAGMAR